MRIGFICNPIAGMGGRVGLKGTDGKLRAAVERGANPRSPDRARRVLAEFRKRMPDTTVLTYADPMGASLVESEGLETEIVGEPQGGALASEDCYEKPEAFDTDAQDTKHAIKDIVAAGADLILFVGGDGTAIDVADALNEITRPRSDSNQSEVPVLGVPGGVKVYSSVFAVSPEDAASIAETFERTEKREVLDIDEDAYRQGNVNPELKSVVSVPVAEELQSSKQLGGGTVDALVEGVSEDIRANPRRTYILGPGSTVGGVKSKLGFEGTAIGVDVWRDGEVQVKDATESEILTTLHDTETSVAVVSPIGGQGFVLGRGNPQLSPTIVRQCELQVISSRAKLNDVTVLRVDSDDPDLDRELRGWTQVRVGRHEYRMVKVA